MKSVWIPVQTVDIIWNHFFVITSSNIVHNYKTDTQ